MEKQESSLFDILIMLARHKVFLLWFLGLVSIASVVYVLVVDEEWSSVAIILPVESSQSPLGNLSGNSLLGLGASLLGMTSDVSAEDLVTIMESRTFSEKMIRKYDLINYFEVEEKDSLKAIDKTLKKFAKDMREIVFNEDNGTVEIHIRSKDRDLSAVIANDYVVELDDYNQHIRMTKGKQNRMFLEKRVQQVMHDVDSLSMVLRDFNQKNRTIVLEDQAMEIVKLYASTAEEKFKLDVERDYMDLFLKKDVRLRENLEEKAKVLQKKLQDMETGGDPTNPNYIIALNNFPEMQYEYAKIYIDLTINKQIFEFLYPQFEKAKIDEAKDTPTLQVLDPARPAGIRTFPKRAFICVSNFIVALIVAIFVIFFLEYVRNHPAQVQEVKNALKRKRA